MERYFLLIMKFASDAFIGVFAAHLIELMSRGWEDEKALLLINHIVIIRTMLSETRTEFYRFINITLGCEHTCASA